MPVLTGANLRRAATLWSWVALLGAPFVLVTGVLLVVGSGPGAPPPVEMRTTGPAGEPLELLGAGRDAAVWGRPAAAGATCTTERSSGDPVAELSGDTGDRRVDDAGGTGSWELLAVTAGTPAAASVTCTGPGLEEVAVSPDPAGARSGGFGVVLLVLAPVLLVLGALTRRALRAAA